MQAATQSLDRETSGEALCGFDRRLNYRQKKGVV